MSTQHVDQSQSQRRAEGGWEPPRELEEYRLMRMLGQGSMGEVWLARDRALDRDVAIKFILSTSSNDRFITEARALARLRHPNVITVYRIGETSGRPYMVTEYLRGHNLENVDLPVDYPLALNLALGLARGLAAAHRQGILHRDVKPGNSFYTDDREVKLLDFGLAKIEDGVDDLAQQEIETSDLELDDSIDTSVTFTPVLKSRPMKSTQAGQLVGTPNYMAPECWLGRVATPQSDIYSLGATLYHLLTGRPPHEGSSLMALARRVREDVAPRLRSKRPELPQVLDDLVERCLRKEPDQRFQDVDEVREILEALARPRRTPSAEILQNPYRGLLAFSSEYREVFFGREAEISQIFERLKTQPCVLVAARSGIGKSSLVGAGVIPRLPEENLDGVHTPWRVAQCVPDRNPFQRLVAAMAPLVGMEEAVLSEALIADPGELARMLRRDGRQGTLLFVDQFEELITFSDPEECARFVDVLQHMLVFAPGIRVLATLRSDFIGQFDRFPGLQDAFSRSLYILGPLTAHGLRDVIVSPAQVCGVSFESQDDVKALIDSAEKSEGSLPLLEFALTHLWERRDQDAKLIRAGAIEEIGGLEGALARHAEEVFAELSPPGQLEARALFLQLVTVQRTRLRRSEAELLERAAPGTENEVKEVLQALVRGRLLLTGQDEHGATYELIHEALIVRWRRLQIWLEENDLDQVMLARLELSCQDWERTGRSNEALWGRSHLAQLSPAARERISARERDFVKASERQQRRQLWQRRVLAGAVPATVLAAVLAVLGVGRFQKELRARQAVAQGQDIMALARIRNQAIIDKRQRAFTDFQQGKEREGEALWQEIMSGEAQLDELYSQALQPLNSAFDAIAGYRAAKRAAAEVLADRVRAAERFFRPQSTVDESLAQLKFFDDEGKYADFIKGDGHVSLTTDPPGATVGLQRLVESAEEGKFTPTPSGSLGTTPLEATLGIGSYLLEIEGKERARVVLPVLIKRNGKRQYAVKLPKLDQIPPGYAYVPGGPFEQGSSDQETYRALVLAQPRHEVMVDSFLIARNETTFADWIAYLEANPSLERAQSMPQILRESGGQYWLEEGPERTPPYDPKASQRDRDEIVWSHWPVVGIGWRAAQSYARWLRETNRVPGARLCLNSEWEKAARGADNRRFPNGQRLRPTDANLVWSHPDSPFGSLLGSLEPVGKYSGGRSIFGGNDMAGSVFEWMEDFLPEQPELRIIRSGSVFWSEHAATSMNRSLVPLLEVPGDAGVRVCADVIWGG